MTKKFPAAIASQEVLVSEPTTSQLRLIVSLGNGSVLPQDFASQSDSAGCTESATTGRKLSHMEMMG